MLFFLMVTSARTNDPYDGFSRADISHAIARLRRFEGWTEKELSERSGVALQTTRLSVNAYGSSIPALDFAKAFGCKSITKMMKKSSALPSDKELYKLAQLFETFCGSTNDFLKKASITRAIANHVLTGDVQSMEIISRIACTLEYASFDDFIDREFVAGVATDISVSAEKKAAALSAMNEIISKKLPKASVLLGDDLVERIQQQDDSVSAQELYAAMRIAGIGKVGELLQQGAVGEPEISGRTRQYLESRGSGFERNC